MATRRVRGRPLQRARHRLFAKQPLCVMCKANGRVTPATERDHIVPLCKGGMDTAANTQALCSECHKVKTLADVGSRGYGQGCDANGMPTSAGHPWFAR